MFLSLALSLGLYYNVDYGIVDMDYINNSKNVNIESIYNKKLSYDEKQLLYRWCKFYSKKGVSDTDIANIVNSAYKYSDYPLLILAIISVESNFNKNAESVKGALGLMQIMPLWLSELKTTFNIRTRNDLKEISNNIMAGNYIITYYVQKEGNLSDGLNEYVNNSSKYVRKVLRRYADITFYLKFGTCYSDKY
jgi:hypothetical protein